MIRRILAPVVALVAALGGSAAQAGEIVLPPGSTPCEADWMNRSRFDTLGNLTELKYLESFAQRGEVGAQLRLGLVRSTRDGKWKAPADLSYNIGWLQKAADKGSKSAGWELASIQFGRHEITHEEFLRAGMRAAEDEGNPWAATYLMQLTNGRWGSKNPPTACHIPTAKDGKCAPDDLLPIASAAKWARIASEGGNVDAQEWLCQSASYGLPERGQAVDKNAAYKWCSLAAHSSCSTKFSLFINVPFGDQQGGPDQTETERWRNIGNQPWRRGFRYFDSNK